MTIRGTFKKETKIDPPTFNIDPLVGSGRLKGKIKNGANLTFTYQNRQGNTLFHSSLWYDGTAVGYDRVIIGDNDIKCYVGNKECEVLQFDSQGQLIDCQGDWMD
jgi:hypothetical protein